MAALNIVSCPAAENLKKRVQIFTEGAVKMVCPILLAISLMSKVDTKKGKDQEEGLMRATISPLSGVTIIFGIILSGGERNWFHVSKALIHLSGFLLMALASNLLLMVSMKHAFMLCVPVVGLVLILLYGCSEWGLGDVQEHVDLYRAYEDKLEATLDFLVSITSLLFLALEGLALGGPHRTDLATALLLTSFIFCIVGVLFMTLFTVPPLIRRAEEETGIILEDFEIFNRALGVGFAAVVVIIASATTTGKMMFVPVAAVICVPLGVVAYDSVGQQTAGDAEDVKPASLDPIKVAFPGLLAVSAHALSNGNPISSDRRWFLLLTAAAILACLVWRLITHQTLLSPAWVKACNAVSLLARILIFAATVTFVIIAFNVPAAVTHAAGPAIHN